MGKVRVPPRASDVHVLQAARPPLDPRSTCTSPPQAVRPRPHLTPARSSTPARPRSTPALLSNQLQPIYNYSSSFLLLVPDRSPKRNVKLMRRRAYPVAGNPRMATDL